ncbi:uncharacterized protein FA14DRAFT_161136 [Meira miltonrushii]|uniref:RING-type domain-containing protein n=1 Tax=Meira miltonrushii TaxID=1280837 RepID=A0A316VFJ7_9BASI|nr:uncharacterized protein FA14DRAFT_161136 [Meira miltonrushii]PWN36407.1 hypothetical protein FA14DRAFT_161136 [Meira miltonrushii]
MAEKSTLTTFDQDATIESVTMTQKAGQSSTEAQNDTTAIEQPSKMKEVKEHPLSLDEENERTLPDIPSASNDSQSQPLQAALTTQEGEEQSNDSAQRTSTQLRSEMISDAILADMNRNRIPENDGENEAISVRRHLLTNAWGGFSNLTRFRKWILVLRLLIALAQVVVGIVVLALPSSLGNSFSFPEECDPEGMFVYLTLHCARVLCSVPVDLYLGLSPHRSPRARRNGADGLLERERNRRVGSLGLDRKMGKFGDLLGFCHIVLFIVGNYVVWTSIECSHQPADSRPLFFTCIAMLSITYVIILEVALMVFLVVFFLPLLIACLSALGLSHRLPQRDIHPETGKISQDDIEKYSRIVYYTPAEGNEEKKAETITRAPMSKADSRVNFLEGESADLALMNMGNKTGPAETSLTNANADVEAAVPESGSVEIPPQTPAEPQQGSDQKQQPQKRRRLGRLIGLSRREESSASLKTNKVEDAGQSGIGGNIKTKYPLYPIPAHRATCPICLSDYEEVRFGESKTQEGRSSREEGEGEEEVRINPAEGDDRSRPAHEGEEEAKDEITKEATEKTIEEPEPLRLLRCGHVMHKQCVDQWLTAVSGRCPVCQRAILSSGDDENVV